MSAEPVSRISAANLATSAGGTGPASPTAALARPMVPGAGVGRSQSASVIARNCSSSLSPPAPGTSRAAALARSPSAST